MEVTTLYLLWIYLLMVQLQQELLNLEFIFITLPDQIGFLILMLDLIHQLKEQVVFMPFLDKILEFGIWLLINLSQRIQ